MGLRPLCTWNLAEAAARWRDRHHPPLHQSLFFSSARLCSPPSNDHLSLEVVVVVVVVVGLVISYLIPRSRPRRVDPLTTLDHSDPTSILNRLKVREDLELISTRLTKHVPLSAAYTHHHDNNHHHHHGPPTPAHTYITYIRASHRHTVDDCLPAVAIFSLPDPACESGMIHTGCCTG